MIPRSYNRSRLVQRIQLTLTCVAIAANALCAGGIFTFPLLSPALAEHLKLTQPQLTTIVLAGMIGQYPFAALVGKVIDQYGPWACSLASSLLFSTGFGLFAREIAKTPDDITAPSKSSFERLTIFYFMAGLGTVTSYFSSLFAAQKNFVDYPGMAAGTSMALFGLSPLFLSVLASTFFTNEDTGLEVTRFVAFMAILAGVVHIFGALNLRTPSIVQVGIADVVSNDSDEESFIGASSSERTPLIAGKPTSVVQVTVVPVEQTQTVFELLKDPYFWILASLVLVCLGSCEMVISNIGTIVLSLPSSSTTSSINSSFFIAASSSAAATSTQVRLLSFSNTISRLLVGPLADFVSPVASAASDGALYRSRKHRLSRIAFLSFPAFLLVCTYSSMFSNSGIRSQDALWILSVGTGIAYGAVFTALPGIVSAVWGLNNLGRNFGIITYAPFIGTPVFSYLYAFVSAAHAREGGSDGVCRGAVCWRFTFGVAATATAATLAGSIMLWRKWKGRV